MGQRWLVELQVRACGPAQDTWVLGEGFLEEMWLERRADLPTGHEAGEFSRLLSLQSAAPNLQELQQAGGQLVLVLREADACSPGWEPPRCHSDKVALTTRTCTAVSGPLPGASCQPES